MKKIVFIIICLILGLIIYQKEDIIFIPNDSIRVRIIANSNNISDMYHKQKIKEAIKMDLYNLVGDANNSMEASVTIENNINEIRNIIAKKTDNFTINYGNNYFPKKIYKGVVYNEGFYKYNYWNEYNDYFWIKYNYFYN